MMHTSTVLAILIVAAGFAAQGDGAAHATSFAHLERMAAEHQHDRPAATPAATTEPARPVTGEEITFGEVEGRPARGYLAHPQEQPGKAHGGTAAAPVPLPAL